MMSEVLDIEITKSVDVVHVGDEFLMYVTIRNKFPQALAKISVTHDLPKGFFIRTKDQQPRIAEKRGWWRTVLDVIQDYLYMPSTPLTVFGSRRSMSWDTNVLSNESYTITIPMRAGGLFPPVLKPDTYRLIFDIQYTYDGQEHSNQAKTDLIVYSHAGGVYLGAMIGGVIGAFLRAPSFSEQFILQLSVGSIMGLVLAVVFRRKANVQSFIAVEDFWGGFLTGIVGSYGGQDVLGRFLAPGPG